MNQRSSKSRWTKQVRQLATGFNIKLGCRVFLFLEEEKAAVETMSAWASEQMDNIHKRHCGHI